MDNGGSASLTRGTAIEVHFQSEAFNEILKGFCLKLTPMGNAMPLPAYLSQHLKPPVIIATETPEIQDNGQFLGLLRSSVN
ncbi:hypothetical protein LC607_28275 [Nostoc sp. CHAB 5824]|nr:hypothetical protein [Nostoc sp. CHAB 5824]